MAEAILEQLEPDLRDKLMAEAEFEHRPVTQIVHDLVREFVERQRKARENSGYLEFMERKASAARADIRAGRFYTNEEVSARFAARRAKLRAEQV